MPSQNEGQHRRSIRLREFDYSGAGAYFVTVCSVNRQSLFGQIVDGTMRLNGFGEIVDEEWHRTAILRTHVRLDAFVVMPNHVHGVICLNEGEGKARLAPTIGRFGQPAGGSLGAIVGAFKSASTKRINDIRATRGAGIWQRNYFEHVIRNEAEMERIREYISLNPAGWSVDANNPNRVVAGPPQSEFDEIFVGARRALPSSGVGNKQQ